jgi:abortive infection bacteriophage resistance protein
MDALERLEVAARTAVSDVMSASHGPHWFMDRGHFEPTYRHAAFLSRVHNDIGSNPNTQAQFIQHYYATYSRPDLPPSWMVFELLSFGTVSLVYKNLLKPHRQAIASRFGLPPDKLASWLHALTHLRNVCAHHGRVWNRTFGISPTVPRSERRRVPAAKKFYAHAVVMQILLRTVSGDTHWVDRLAGLLEEHPEVDPSAMGFPPGWRQFEVWR